jgi:protein-tyrosine kinase
MDNIQGAPDVGADELPSAAIEVGDPTAFVQLSPKLAAAVRANNAQSESISAVRNYLVGQHQREGWRALAMCGTTAGNGCTFVATNVAMAAARAGLNTLLIDADMRDPGVDKMFIPGAEPKGLKQYLAADSDEGPLVMAQVIPNLSILYAGGVAEDAQDLLSSNRLALLFEDSVRTFDMTIVDCPPAANYSDARRIASLLRHAAIIVRRDHSLAHDVRTLIDELRSDHVNVVGTVLNVFG